MTDNTSDTKICRYCGKVYRSWSGLNDHERRHDNRAPFRCNSCGKPFYSRTNLLRHRCNVHGTTKKQQKCEVCHAEFATKAELNLHTNRVHKENQHKCDQCSRTFTTHGSLNDHIDAHVGVKRHVCQCGKSYRYITGLSRHKQQCSSSTTRS